VVIPLDAQGLSFRYGDGFSAVDGVDLRLAAGELVAVVGPNGSGKTTLLKLLGGLLAPDAGVVRLFGAELASLAVRERARRIARVPQVLEALPEVDVAEFVRAGRYAHRSWMDNWLGSRDAEDARALAAALGEADVADFADRRLSELSGGQGQRVLVARALAQEADVLLFDEPTASLDPDHRVRLFELIAGLTRAGRGAVVATHELALASRFADRVLLLEQGRTVAEGAVEAVLCRPVLEPVFGPHLAFVEDAACPGRPLIAVWPAKGGAGETGGA